MILGTDVGAACIFTATASMYFAKLPALMFLIRKFNIHKNLRYIGYFVMIMTALGFLVLAL